MSSDRAGSCSYCGGGGSIWQRIVSPTTRVAYVQCRRCDCRGPLVRFSADDSTRPHIAAEQRAIEAWNGLHNKG